MRAPGLPMPRLLARLAALDLSNLPPRPFPQQQLTVLHRASLLWQVGLSKNLTQTLASQKEGPVGTFAW